LSGLDFQAELVTANNSIPIVLMTGHGGVPMSVKAMKLGAVDFLLKTFRERTAGCRNGRLERDDKRREAEQ